MKKIVLHKTPLNLIKYHLNFTQRGVLICMVLVLLPLQFIFSHGTVTTPPSRVWICFQENPENPDSPACIAGVASYGTQWLYDWPAILQPSVDGNHTQYVLDGNLASGGDPDKYGGMDQIRDDWIATPVAPGPYTVTWTITAPHATLYYRVYITKANWTPDQPLTWDSLELLTETGPLPLSDEDNIDVILPERTGRHVIYSVWQRSLSPEAFYSTSDVDFGTLSTDLFDKSSLDLKNYPNPFNGTSTISYNLNKATDVSLKVYNILGKEVSTLAEGTQSKGTHKITVNSDDLSSGVYFYIFEIENYSETRRMVVLK